MNHPLKRLIKKVKTIPRRKLWGIVIAFLLIYVAFFDTHSLVSRMKNMRKISHLENEVEHYQKELDANLKKLQELQSNDSNLVKFAREEYYMKRTNEDIYLIDEE